MTLSRGITLFSSVVFSLLLVGCGDNIDTKVEATQSTAPPKTKVVVGTSASYMPWAYQENDVVKGFEIDVWHEIAKRNNYELVIKLGQFSGLMGMLDAGEIDSVAHQMSITPKREEKYYFSSPYAYSFYDLFVKNGASFQNKEDLKGKKVGCWLGNNGELTLREMNDKYNLEFDIVAFDGASIENEVTIGRLDALWQGEVKTLTTISKHNLPLHQLNEKLTFEVNAYPFKQSDKGKSLALEVSKALDGMREDGTLTALSQKWFAVDTTQAVDIE